MRYLSVCSGIEAATVAWHPLGWRPWAFSEIEAFPSAVLAHHYPTVPNLGDMTKYAEWPDACSCVQAGTERGGGGVVRHGRGRAHAPVPEQRVHGGPGGGNPNPATCGVCGGAILDVLVGGTPCQSFSVAGLRAGLADPRGNLALVFLAIADRYRPRWVVWENVPGVLSSNGGRDFGSFIGGLAELGYGFAYRVLDAQYVRVDGHPRAVPQRRRRVFVVGHLGSWQRAAAVLFERESLSGHPAPRREAGQRAAPTVSGAPPYRSTGNERVEAEAIVPSYWDGGQCSDTLDVSMLQKGQMMPEKRRFPAVLEPVAHALRADGFDASEDGTGRGTPIVPVAFDTTQVTSKANRSNPKPGDPCHPLAAGAHPPAIAFNWQNGGGYGEAHDGLGVSEEHTPPHSRSQVAAVTTAMAVRRLTPLECERLQGFPDNYTRIPLRVYKRRRITKTRPEDRWERNADGTWTLMAADGPRYKALGNSMAVNVMAWIGQRIAMVEAALAAAEEAA